MQITRLLVAAAVVVPLAAGADNAKPQHDGQHDFDFMYGKWKIKIRRLKNPLHGSKDWYEMNGTTDCHPIWGGKGNIEMGELDGPTEHMSAMMVRLYEPKSRQWSLNWVNAKNMKFDVPTVGEFKNGRGEFYDQEMFEGRMILVRYIWSDTTTKTPRFEQSFSDDGGKTWEANWISESAKLE